MDDFFRTPSDVWLVTAFGTLLAPMAEEICFRGFLLPAFSIAYDWLSLPKTPAARERWHITTNLTPAALVFGTLVSSIFFVLLHAEQLAHAWAALGILFVVSLILTAVRIRTRSVPWSTPATTPPSSSPSSSPPAATATSNAWRGNFRYSIRQAR
jgi:membrane protease YdiL (CAAX protease family)